MVRNSLDEARSDEMSARKVEDNVNPKVDEQIPDGGFDVDNLGRGHHLTAGNSVNDSN
jgi:hypothetical protein